MNPQRINISVDIKAYGLQAQANSLIKQKSTQIQQKINKNLEKQKHILKLQQELQQKLRKKNQQIIDKIARSIQTKKKSIQKIKEKCQIKDKYQSQKLTAHRKKQRIQIHKSWRESLKLAQWTNKREGSKSNRNLQILEQKNQNQQNQQMMDRFDGSNTLPNYHGNLPLIRQKTKQNPLAHKQNKSMLPNNSQGPLNNNSNIFISQIQIDQNERQLINKSASISYVDKIRHKTEQKQEEELQKFNAKLLKLQEARLKKEKLQKQKQKRIHEQIKFKQNKQIEIRKNQRKGIVKNKTEHQRIKTAGNSNLLDDSNITQKIASHKNQMFKKWEQQNKIRQQYLFQLRLKKGQNYLQAMKDKSLKNKLNKQIQQGSIQKKLYLQRIRLHQLAKSTSKHTIA